MPVIGSHSELMEWRAFTAASGWRGGAALHIDTGMNRLGLSFEEATALAREPDALSGTTMLMSHLACAERPEHPLNAKQLAGFRELRAMFPGITASLANSSGIFLGPDAHHDLVRPGLALYGANPTPEHLNPMQPVLELRGRIIQLRTVAKDETVGYGATFTTRRRTRLAVVSIGYADGLLRAASGRDDHAGAEAIVAGHPCPVAGAISMDLLALDVTDLPVGTPQRGDLVTFIGDGIGIDDLAARAGTIGYEILTSLGQRYVRRYTGS
jgi:alanine racemase